MLPADEANAFTSDLTKDFVSEQSRALAASETVAQQVEQHAFKGRIKESAMYASNEQE